MGHGKVNEKSRLFKLCGSTTRNLNPALKDTTQGKGNSFFSFGSLKKQTNSYHENSPRFAP